ncbi:MAG: hypothetical protein AB7V08_14910 [Elusimicrobiales bacterium]
MVERKPCRFYKSGLADECVAPERLPYNPCESCERAGVRGGRDYYIPRYGTSRPLRLKNVSCWLLTGEESPRCIAHQFYRFDPCDYCWYQHGRGNKYIPEGFIECPLCGRGKREYEFICYECQIRTVGRLGVGAFRADKKVD